MEVMVRGNWVVLALRDDLGLSDWFAYAITVCDDAAAVMEPVRGCYCMECSRYRDDGRLAFQAYLQEMSWST